MSWGESYSPLVSRMPPCLPPPGVDAPQENTWGHYREWELKKIRNSHEQNY